MSDCPTTRVSKFSGENLAINGWMKLKKKKISYWKLSAVFDIENSLTCTPLHDLNRNVWTSSPNSLCFVFRFLFVLRNPSRWHIYRLPSSRTTYAYLPMTEDEATLCCCHACMLSDPVFDMEYQPWQIVALLCKHTNTIWSLVSGNLEAQPQRGALKNESVCSQWRAGGVMCVNSCSWWCTSVSVGQMLQSRTGFPFCLIEMKTSLSSSRSYLTSWVRHTTKTPKPTKCFWFSANILFLGACFKNMKKYYYYYFTCSNTFSL